jgi:predicted ATP-grasp superfamily ATP-dependent carboligase
VTDSLLFPTPYSLLPAPKALVLDGDSRAALAIVRSLGRRGIEVTVASEEKTSLAGCSKWCSDRLVCPCPRATPRLFEDWLTSTLALMPDAVLFFASDVTASVVGKCRADLPEPALALLLPQESLAVALDKSATLDLARKLGVPAPRSAQFARGEAIDETCADLGYPVAIKASQSDLPYRCATTYARDPGEFRMLLDEVLRECPAALVQEVIPGEGTAIFALFDTGKPLVTFAHRRLIEKPPWGGVSALCESIDPPLDALGFALDMLKELNWHGPAMVEFKRNPDGVPCLMEINPRFWGSLELAVRSGVDFPYMCMQLALGEPMETPSMRPAVNRWVLGELDSLIAALLSGVPGRSRIAELGSHLRGLRYGPCCEVERLSDLRPAVYEYAAWLRTAAGRFAARWKGGVARWGKLSAPEG